jgi:ABC-type transport system substrate-binding protein
MVVAPRPAGGDPATMMASSYACAGRTPDGQKPEPANPGGFCDALLQPTIEAAMSGQIPFAEASARVESALWAQAVSLPLYQQAQVVAVRREVSGVRIGPAFTGPFSSAAQWLGPPSNTPGY